MTAALWTGVRAWMLGAALYLPEAWLTPEARQRAKIPAAVRFQEKWRLALTLLRQVRAAGFQVTAVLGDAEFGDNATLRRTLHRAKLPYALGVSSTLTVFRGTPRGRRPAAHRPARRPPTRLQLTDGSASEAVRTHRGRSCPPARGDASRGATARIARGPRTSPRCASRPAHDWRARRLAPEVWLLFERDLGTTPRIKAYLVGLPPTASLQRARQPGASALGDRAAVSRTEGRTRARSLRGPVVSRLAAPRRAHRARVHLAATGAATRRRAAADAADRARRHHRNSHGAFLSSRIRTTWKPC